jgi:hypothetical protein
MKRLTFALALTAALGLTVDGLLARVDVKIDFDKTFDFKAVKTWGWDPNQPGEVIMARTQTDDPDAMKARAEPWILDSVATEFKARGVQQATTNPNLIARYYLLLSTNQSAQTMGQFLPGSVSWGLPPFLANTTSLKILNRGSLVIDLVSKETVVWRGVAQANIKIDSDDKKREALLREGVRDLIKRFPPKQ